MDLFAGAGGLSLGFKNAGFFSIAVAIENNKYAKETCRINHKETIVLDDVLDYSDFSAFKISMVNLMLLLEVLLAKGFQTRIASITR